MSETTVLVGGTPEVVLDVSDDLVVDETVVVVEAGPRGDPGLDGPDGADGIPGAPGEAGADGADGAPGSAGVSAYQVWLAAGNTGTVEVYLASLVGLPGAGGQDGAAGQDGAPGSDGLPGTDGTPGIPGVDGVDGAPGVDGASAYELAVAGGFVGDQAAWLTSLPGTDGLNGTNGTNGTDGVGVPTGGVAGSVLAKVSDTDHDSEWATNVPRIWSGTQAAYDALGSYSATTIYVVTG